MFRSFKSSGLQYEWFCYSLCSTKISLHNNNFGYIYHNLSYIEFHNSTGFHYSNHIHNLHYNINNIDKYNHVYFYHNIDKYHHFHVY